MLWVLRTTVLSKKINLMTACPHRNCKLKSLLMAFSFISCMIQGIENSEELSSKLQIPSRVIKFHVPGFGDSSSLITLVPLPPRPQTFFFFLQAWHANHAVLTSFLFSLFFWNILFSTVNSFGGVPHWGSTAYNINYVSARSPASSATFSRLPRRLRIYSFVWMTL